MQRQFLRLRAGILPASSPARRAPMVCLPTQRLASTASAPPAAEKASAQSGGSRSKDAKEAHEGVEETNIDEGVDGRGKTGGGPPLKSSHTPPAQPKILNAKVSGDGQKMSKEQQKEVDEHNKEFEKRHDRAEAASDDKVNKKFWNDAGGQGADR